jgi:hypothetical protein
MVRRFIRIPFHYSLPANALIEIDHFSLVFFAFYAVNQTTRSTKKTKTFEEICVNETTSGFVGQAARLC